MAEWVTTVVEQLGYAGVGLLTLLEVVFPPIPSEIILPFSGFAAANSETLGLFGVALAGTVGSVAGALVLYGLGYLLPPARIDQWVDQYGSWLMVDADDVEKARAWFRERGQWAVFIGRLIPGVRSYVSIPAGNARMNLATFTLWTTLGTFLWSFLLAWIGSLLGENYDQLGSWLDAFGWLVAIVVVMIVVWWVWRRRRNASSEG